MIQLYEFSVSRSMRAHWALKEVGADFSVNIVNLQEGEGQKPEYLAIHPLGKVPAIKDGDFTVWESAAIVNYLCEKYPEKNLIPKQGTHERATYDQWSHYCQTELDANLWAIAKQRFVFPEDQRIEAAIPGFENDFKKNIKAFDKHLENNDYILGDNFSGADITMTHTVMWARSWDLTADCKNINDYIKRCKDRENFPKELYKEN